MLDAKRRWSNVVGALEGDGKIFGVAEPGPLRDFGH